MCKVLKLIFSHCFPSRVSNKFSNRLLCFQSCVTALDQTWHPEHFVCAACGRPFGESGFHERDGKPYCRDDYFALFAPRCGGCGQPIADSYISALSAHWHSECFVCSVSSLLVFFYCYYYSQKNNTVWKFCHPPLLWIG